MFRTFVIAATAALISTAAVANDKFVEIANQDDDRAIARAISQVGVSGKSFTSVPSAAGIFADLAAEEDDRTKARALSGTAVNGTLSTKNVASISALEVALKHAIEDDNRTLAAHLKAQLGR